MLTQLEAEIDTNGVVRLINPIKIARKGRALVQILDEEIIVKNGAESDDGKGTVRDLFGSASLGHPTGSDNSSIDGDLAKEYSSKHED